MNNNNTETKVEQLRTEKVYEIFIPGVSGYSSRELFGYAWKESDAKEFLETLSLPEHRKRRIKISTIHIVYVKNNWRRFYMNTLQANFVKPRREKNKVAQISKSVVETDKNTAEESKSPKTWHYHITSTGKVVECYHVCKSTLLSFGFWIGMTLGYPLEHWLWEHTFLNKLLTLIGL